MHWLKRLWMMTRRLVSDVMPLALALALIGPKREINTKRRNFQIHDHYRDLITFYREII